MAMIRHIINQSLRSRIPTTTTTTLPLLLSPINNGAARSATSLHHTQSSTMLYDRLADSVNSKIRRLDHPDPRFLRYTSPHPTSFLDLTPILSSPRIRITTLPNGLRVATQSSPTLEKTATVGVWIDAGSRFETDETNGVAHFLEHMICNGTKTRSGKALWEELENMGGHMNAYTRREQTTYYVKVMEKEVPNAMDILADMLQNSSMEEGQIDRERNVILQEKEEVLKMLQMIKEITNPMHALFLLRTDDQ